MNIFIYFKNSDIKSFDALSIPNSINYCVSGEDFPKNIKSIKFNLVDFYSYGIIKKCYTLFRFYIQDESFDSISGKEISLYCPTDNALIRLLVSLLRKKNTVNIIMVYNYILNETPVSKKRNYLSRFFKKNNLYFISAFFPSTLGSYADSIYSKFDMTIDFFLKNQINDKVNFKKLEQKQLQNHHGRFKFKVGLFLSAWSYHGHYAEEDYQNETFETLQNILQENKISFFTRPHPHQNTDKLFCQISKNSYLQDIASCEYIVSIASTAMFEKEFLNQKIRRIDLPKNFLNLDKKYMDISLFDIKELCKDLS